MVKPREHIKKPKRKKENRFECHATRVKVADNLELTKEEGENLREISSL